MAAKFPARGVVVWHGPSELGGGDVVVIATGYHTAKSNQNVKMGDVIQLWILAADTDPLALVQQREDAVICGDCELRGSRTRIRGCYVQVQWYPRKIWLTLPAAMEIFPKL